MKKSLQIDRDNYARDSITLRRNGRVSKDKEVRFIARVLCASSGASERAHHRNVDNVKSDLGKRRGDV